ncbi:uncharacterized protein [Littorina saxatilis]|uniref:uncharacterized protein n=1 Tax=Littorina saxatilis TaxID=31220 RepID=UPI0038B4DCB7
MSALCLFNVTVTVGTTPRADDITTASSVTTMQPLPGSTGVTTPPPPPPTTTTTATTTTTTTTTTTLEPTTTTTSTTSTTTMQTTQATSPTSTTTTTMPTSTTSLQTAIHPLLHPASSSTTDVSGSGSSEGDYIKDYTEGEAGGEGEGSETDTRSASSSQGAGPTVSDYLPLIIGVTLGVLVGVAVVGVLAWLWTRNKRKQKALRVEEDQLNIIGTVLLSRAFTPTIPPVSNFDYNINQGVTEPAALSTSRLDLNIDIDIFGGIQTSIT